MVHRALVDKIHAHVMTRVCRRRSEEGFGPIGPAAASPYMQIDAGCWHRLSGLAAVTNYYCVHPFVRVHRFLQERVNVRRVFAFAKCNCN